MVHAASYDCDARLELMDRMGVSHGIVYPNVGGFGNQNFLKVEDTALRIACVEIYNDWMSDLQQRSGGRILPWRSCRGGTSTPAWPRSTACTRNGAKGIVMCSNPHDSGMPNFAQPDWRPFWEVCEAPGDADQLPHRRLRGRHRLVRQGAVLDVVRRREAQPRWRRHLPRPAALDGEPVGQRRARALPEPQLRVGRERRGLDPVPPRRPRLPVRRDGARAPGPPLDEAVGVLPPAVLRLLLVREPHAAPRRSSTSAPIASCSRPTSPIPPASTPTAWSGSEPPSPSWRPTSSGGSCRTTPRSSTRSTSDGLGRPGQRAGRTAILDGCASEPLSPPCSSWARSPSRCERPRPRPAVAPATVVAPAAVASRDHRPGDGQRRGPPRVGGARQPGRGAAAARGRARRHLPSRRRRRHRHAGELHVGRPSSPPSPTAGIITFDCGPGPVTIVMTDTAKVVNTSAVVVLDGGGKVTLSGADQRRILYMNTCDQAQVWTTSHCQDQDQPQLTIQRMTLHPRQQHRRADRRRWRRGGVRPRRPREGARQHVHGEPVRPDRAPTSAAARCACSASPTACRSSWRRARSPATPARTARRSRASACRGRSTTASSPATAPSAPAPTRLAAGTPGGGSGGAIYLDGNLFTLDLAGSIIHDNTANEGGGAIFFVSNDRTGELRISTSVLERNSSRGFETAGFPGIFFLGLGTPQVTDSTIR